MRDKKFILGLILAGFLNVGIFAIEDPLDLAFSLAKKNWISLNATPGQGGVTAGTPSLDPLLRPYALEIRSLMARGYSAQESSAAVRQKMALDLGPSQDRQIRTRLKSLEEKQALRTMENPSRGTSGQGLSSMGQWGPDHRNPGGRN